MSHPVALSALRPSRLSCAALLASMLLSCSAASAGVPASLVGEWFMGPQYPADVYTTRLTGASADARRLLLNADGTYLYTEFTSSPYASSLGFTGYPITCESMDALVERGTFTVSGNRVTFRTGSVNKLLAYSPDRLNNGCKRQAGMKRSSAESGSDTLTWTLGSGKLTVKAPDGSATYERRTQATPPAPTSAAGLIAAELRGEWHSGRVSPVEYYNAATGQWAEASGTSVILKIAPNATYERSGLTVVTTYGCTSKLLVTEKGTVKQNGTSLTFTPTTSAATGYTCSPDRKSSAKNNVKPYTEQYGVQVQPDGQHVLALKSGGGQTLFNRPRGTAPESAPGQGGPVTPPPPGGAPATGPVTSTPVTSAPVTPARWTARGTWNAVITTPSGSVRVRFEMDDDEPRVLGSGYAGNDAVAWIQGNSATGTLSIGLEVDGDREVTLTVTGTFSGNTYRGTFTTTGENGESLAGGTITMSRP